MKKYIRPAIKLATIEEPLMAALSLHDKLGDEQLGNDTSFDTEEPSGKPVVNVWD
ncbi:MAG: hypothetical protein IKX36_01020 [Prevotella sp.]|nr:hypothetical protein [Prevotella sp.]